MSTTTPYTPRGGKTTSPRPPTAPVDLEGHPLADASYRERCRARLEADGVLVLEGFLTPAAVASVCAEGERKRAAAFYCTTRHNVYLTTPEPGFADDHPRNRTVGSTKGCIADDQIDPDSALRALYDAPAFRDFLCAVLGEAALHPYADPLSSVNLHYADAGQELGWHFDNSSFAITLMIQAPEGGGAFEYVRNLRDAASGDMNYDGVARVLDGRCQPDLLEMGAGTLVLFRGRNALHRVTPVAGTRTRMLAVLAYNGEPGVALSASARMTFYGRLG